MASVFERKCDFFIAAGCGGDTVLFLVKVDAVGLCQ